MIRKAAALGRRYYLLFSAGTLSDIGGFSTHTAIILHVYNLTGGSKSMMGVAAMSTLVPFVLAASFGGVWAEKYDRRKIMIVNDIVRIPLVLAMMATGSVLGLLALQALVSASTAFFMPSRNAIIPELVRKDQVHLANTINGGVLSMVHVLGPVMGATIYAFTGGLKWIVILDAGTYAASAALLFALTYQPARKLAEASSDMIRDIAAGLAYVRRERDFLHLFILFVSVDTTIGMLIPLLRPFIDEVLHGTDENYGHLIGVFGLGGLAGPPLGYWAGRRFGLGRVLTFNLAGECVMLILFSRTTNFYASAAILFLWGVNVFVLIPGYMSYIHSYARAEFMGRTFALFDLTFSAAQIMGAVVVVLLADRFSTPNLLTAAGLCYGAILIVTYRSPGAKLLRSRRGDFDKAAEHGNPSGPEAADPGPAATD